MPDDDTVTLPKSILKTKVDKIEIELSEVAEPQASNLAPQETYDTLQRIEYMEKTKFQTSITCSTCGATADFSVDRIIRKGPMPHL